MCIRERRQGRTGAPRDATVRQSGTMWTAASALGKSRYRALRLVETLHRSARPRLAECSSQCATPRSVAWRAQVPVAHDGSKVTSTSRTVRSEPVTERCPIISPAQNQSEKAINDHVHQSEAGRTTAPGAMTDWPLQPAQNPSNSAMSELNVR
jgi:hypothetical protein